MGFFPTGPITTTFMVIIFLTAIVLFARNDQDQRRIALALIVSWVGARVSTATGNPAYLLITLTFSGIVTAFGFTIISRSISMLYGVRILLVAGLLSGVFTWFWLWEINFVFLALQILLAWGSLGGSGRILGSDSSRSRRSYIYRPLALSWRKANSYLGRHR